MLPNIIAQMYSLKTLRALHNKYKRLHNSHNYGL